jgi:hypothetical protein
MKEGTDEPEQAGCYPGAPKSRTDFSGQRVVSFRVYRSQEWEGFAEAANAVPSWPTKPTLCQLT